MSRGTAFDLSQSDQVSAFKVAVAVLKLPQCRIWRAVLKNIADFVEAVHIKLSHKRRDVGVLEVLPASGQKLRSRRTP